MQVCDKYLLNEWLSSWKSGFNRWTVRLKEPQEGRPKGMKGQWFSGVLRLQSVAVKTDQGQGTEDLAHVF